MKNKLYFLLLLFGMLVFVLTYGGPQSNFWNTLILSISFKPLIMILLLIIILDNIKKRNYYYANILYFIIFCHNFQLIM